MLTASKVAISIFIVGLLGAQALFAFAPPHRYRYWPLLSYPMYNEAHAKDEPVSNFRLIGVLEGGAERPITEKDLKLDFWRYLRGPVRSAQRGNAHALLSYLQPYEHRARLTFVAVRLENRPVRLVNGHVTPAPTETATLILRHPA